MSDLMKQWNQLPNKIKHEAYMAVAAFPALVSIAIIGTALFSSARP